ncbi:hypothetical protein FH972_016138 [Carpinus fangiana]|uniref:Kazal-like domain-containing protein n=1 Tax=Carpinus fangiana TaxID=176857 RepID=A0A5N6RH02_9ROSI|nr:hypothetical protein FH972_016138 [Carpinus fangiana]
MSPQFPKPACSFLIITVAIIFTVSTIPTVRSDYIASVVGSLEKNYDDCIQTKPASCPVNCFRPNPVCGIDGVTYWCGCPDAACAGTRVAKMGYCEVGNGSGEPGPVSGQALLLVQIVWLIVLGFSVLFGLL